MAAALGSVPMTLPARLAASVLLLLLSACGTLEISVEATPTGDAAATGTVSALELRNAELATRVASLASATNPSLPTPRTITVTPAEPPATRIAFLNGASVGVVSAPIAPDQSQRYVLDALQGQPMYAYVASANSDVSLSMATEKGATILLPADKKTSWQGTLPLSGDYYLTIHGGSMIENFTLTVTLPWRLQFAQGADSATVSGQTVAGYDVSYTVYARKGQTMSVDLEQASSKASLAVYGFTDGQRYLASDAGQRSFQFKLPQTQDYIVVVVPFNGSEVSYTLTVKVQ